MAGEPTRETAPSGPARGVGALDRVAERLAADAGVELGVADSPSDLIAAHRLRYRDAARARPRDRRGRSRRPRARRVRRARAADLRVGRRHAGGDAAARAADAGQAAAGRGGVRPRTSSRPARSSTSGRRVVAPGLGAERARQVADGLLAQAWFETRARGYLVMAAIASSRLGERYRALGLDVEVLGRLRRPHRAAARPVDRLRAGAARRARYGPGRIREFASPRRGGAGPPGATRAS